jgi:hypothetical protein
MSTQGPDFPNLVPTARSMSPGDFAGKTFRSQSGIEARVQYGNKAFDKTMDLEYSNITETDAALIHDHYLACNGTLYYFGLVEAPKSGNSTFHLGDSNSTNTSNRYSAAPFGLRYRYAEPPQFNSVKPGRMSVTVKLIGVLDS